MKINQLTNKTGESLETKGEKIGMVGALGFGCITRAVMFRRIGSVVLAMALFALVAGRAGAQTLTVTNNLELWLKADAGVTTNANGQVSNWASQVGSAHAGVYSTNPEPVLVSRVLDGKPAILFDGTTGLQLAGLPGDVNPPYTFFIVLANYTNASEAFGGGGVNFRFGLNGNVGTVELWPGNVQANVAPTNGGSVVSAIVGYNGTASTLQAFQQGLQILPTTTNTSAGQIPIAAQSTLGKNNTLTGNGLIPYRGYIAEILLYTNALSAADEWTVNEYLFARYAIPEPSSAMLLGLGAAALLAWRRKK